MVSETSEPDLDGDDIIRTGSGRDVIFGGGANDLIDSFGADADYFLVDADIVVGDQGRAFFDQGVVEEVITDDFDHGGDDVINVGNGYDVVFGGTGNDQINAGRRSTNATDTMSGKVISFNFGSLIPNSEIVGVAGVVPANNWNNVPSGQNVVLGDDPGEEFIFNDGSIANGITLELGRDLDSFFPGDLTPDSHDEITPDPIETVQQNLRLFEGYLFTDIFKTLSADIAGLDVVGDSVDIYVYLDADDANSSSPSSVRTISDGNTTFYLDDPIGNTFEGTFHEANSTDALAPGLGNYVVFRDVTSTEFNLRIDDAEGSPIDFWNRPALTGMQIVESSMFVELDGIDDRNVLVGDNGYAEFKDQFGKPTLVSTTDHRFASDQFTYDDEINGGNGHDILIGGNESDILRGNYGDDLILGDNASLVLEYLARDHIGAIEKLTLLDDGIGGDDVLDGGMGVDDLYGQFGNDRYVFSGGMLGNDNIFEAGDNDSMGRPNDAGDTLDFSEFADRVKVDLWHTNNQVVSHGNLEFTLPTDSSFENVIGGQFNDEIQGNSRQNRLEGLDGDDILKGFAGEDTLIGGAGNDNALGGQDDDTVLGGLGDDVLVGESGDDDIRGNEGNDVIKGGSGSDLLVGNSGDDVINADDDVEPIGPGPAISAAKSSAGGDDRVFGGTGNDVITAGEGDDLVHGGAGDDEIHGNAGIDELYGDDGDDQLFGEEGTDTIFGNHGDDNIDGGPDADWLFGNKGDDIIVGAGGRDFIEGNSGDDHLHGDEGSDILLGGTGNDTMFGDEGDDAMTGDQGDDTLRGGIGRDVLLGGSDNDTLSGEEGADTLLGEEGDDTISGGLEADVAWGGSGDDIIEGDEGDDQLRGQEGDDTIHGNTGDDDIRGDAGDDTLEGNDGFDVVLGDDGDDLIAGNAGEDLLEGGAGDDAIDGGSEDDTIRGNEGNDQIIGRAGQDAIYGGPGHDEIDGGSGNDVLEGDADNDNIIGGPGVDLIRGGSGDDVIDGEAGDDQIDGDEGRDTIAGSDGNDVIHGGSGDDTITGDDGIDKILGEAGRDTISGGDDDDEILGGDDDDSLSGDAGIDVILGGSGDDAISGGSGDDNIDGESGHDTISGNEGHDTIQGGTENDVIEGNSGDDTIRGEEGNDAIAGDLGNDILLGGTGNDLIDGGLGDDDIDGEAGEDSLHGREGDDTIEGGEDDDVIFGNEGFDVIDGETGDDTIDAGLGDDVALGGPGNDLIKGGEGNDILDGEEGDDRVEGDAGNDTIRGGTGHDRLLGRDGADTIEGGVGNDTLIGGPEDDVLRGDSGDDLIEGNAGNDTADGGVGDDVILGQIGDDQLTGGDGRDIIIGDIGDDVIRGGNDDDYLEGNEGDDQIEGDEGDDEIHGHAGGDTIGGGPGRDAIDAGEGDDTIDGGDDDDLIHAGPGEDGVTGGKGNDHIYGGFDNDTIAGDEGMDTIDGGEGHDTITGGPQSDHLFGGEGNDNLDGGSGSDLIVGFEGNDTIDGGDDPDTIYGGFGVDNITGGEGNDNIFGDSGNDLIDAGPGDDLVFGDEGDDAIEAGSGDDLVEGGPGNDVIAGQDGDDEIRGGLGNDEIEGGSGLDLIKGEEGDDSLFGQADDDVLIGSVETAYSITTTLSLGTLTSDTLLSELNDGSGVNLADGNDFRVTRTDGSWFDVDLPAGLSTVGDVLDTINLAAGVQAGFAQVNANGDRLVVSDPYGPGKQALVVSSLNGSTAAQDLGIAGSASGPATREHVLLGNTILGVVDTSTLLDDLNDGGGIPTVVGNDIRVTTSNGVKFDLDLGSVTTVEDLIHLFADTSSLDATLGPNGAFTLWDDSPGFGPLTVESLGSPAAEALGLLTVDNDDIYGGSGNDLIDGGIGDDLLFGQEDADVILGGYGNDTIEAGSGKDLVDGEAGDDEILGQENDDVLLGGEGDDDIQGGPGDDTIEGGVGVDLLDGGTGTNSIEQEQGPGPLFLLGFYQDFESEFERSDFFFTGPLNPASDRPARIWVEDYLTEVCAPQLPHVASIDIEKFTLGIDVDQPTGPYVQSGEIVTFNYVVTNTGTAQLFDVEVFDDVLGDVGSIVNQGDGDDVLSIGERWTFEKTGIAGVGQQSNLSQVEATSSDVDVSDSDLSYHFGVDSRIEILKLVNGIDAAAANPPLIGEGDAAVFSFEVTNMGNAPLTDLDVYDDVLGRIVDIVDQGDGDAGNVLSPGETWIYEKEVVALRGLHENTASVTSTDPLGETRTDSDNSQYVGVVSEISVEKSTSSSLQSATDADEPTGPLFTSGTPVTFEYSVTNEGNQPLTSVALVDDNGTPDDQSDDFSPIYLSGDANNDNLLDVGETWLYQAESIAGLLGLGQYVNVAQASAEDVLLQIVSDEDASHHFVANPQIDIEKLTNGINADDPAGSDVPSVVLGETVEFTYVLTNPGNVPISYVALIDDHGTPSDTSDDFVPLFESGDENANGILDINETWIYSAARVADEPQLYGNTVEAIGFDPIDRVVLDTDLSHHQVQHTPIVIEKATNALDPKFPRASEDADTTDGPLVGLGDTVTFTYLVENQGLLPVSDVFVTDDNGTPGDFSDDLSLTFIDGDMIENGILDPGEVWLYTASTTATEGGLQSNLAEVSGIDSMGFGTSDDDISHHFVADPSVSFEKLTSGQDADDPNGEDVPNVLLDATVSFIYLLTNTGNVPLSEVEVIDDNGTPDDEVDDFRGQYAGGDDNNSRWLDPGETWTFTASKVADELGLQHNTAKGRADDALDTWVSDTDISHHLVTNGVAEIDVEVGLLEPNVIDPRVPSISTRPILDADTPLGAMIQEIGNDNATFVYTVRNSGDLPLTNVALTDAQFGELDYTYLISDGNGDDILDVNEIWEFELTSSITGVLGQQETLATATGHDALGEQVMDSDPAYYYVVRTEFSVESAINADNPLSPTFDEDADFPSGPVATPDSNVTFTYLLENTGNAPLTVNSLIDDNGTPSDSSDDFEPSFVDGDTNVNSLLDPGEVWLYLASTVADDIGQQSGGVTVSVTDVLDVDWSDWDAHHHLVGVASVSIETAVNDQPADTLPGVGVGPNSFAFVVSHQITNTGNIPLDHVEVDDSTLGSITDQAHLVSDGNGDDVLDVGEVWRYETPLPFFPHEIGEPEFLGTVTALTPTFEEVSNSNSAFVFALSYDEYSAIWDGTALIGVAGDGMSWSDEANWTTDGLVDSNPSGEIPPPVVFLPGTVDGPIELDFTDEYVDSLVFFEDTILTGSNTLIVQSGEVYVQTGVTVVMDLPLEGYASQPIIKTGGGTLILNVETDDIEVSYGSISGAADFQNVDVLPFGKLSPAGPNVGTFSSQQITFANGSVFKVDVGGLLSGVESDLVEVDGQANLMDGNLDLEILDSYAGPVTPGTVHAITILTAQSIVGEFEPLNRHLGGGIMIDVVYRTLPSGLESVQLEFYNALPGDLDGDRTVDTLDVFTVLGNLGQTGLDADDGDEDGDGTVSVLEAFTALGNLGASASSD